MAYWIVSNNELPDVVNPEIPKWYTERDQATRRRALSEKWWGDFQTKRILLANTIDDALQVGFLRGDITQKELYVYQVFYVQTNLLRKPTKEEEPMVQKVGLSWYTGRVKVKYMGKISRTILEKRNTDFFLLRPEKPGEKDSPRVYLTNYKWEWVEKA